MRAVSAFLAAAVLGATLWIGARGAGPVPPIGPLLDPANGVWHVAASAVMPRESAVTIPGLDSAVRVLYDDRGVPHIFAATELDAERALGYVVARDRLFQLELQARAGAGTLTELLGPRALPLDRETHALGLPASAEWKFAALMNDRSMAGPGGPSPSPSAERRAPSAAVTAFALGVNSYIAQLAPRDDPFEYKLLGRRPAPWSPINTVHLFNRMAYTLAYNEDELTHLLVAARVGRAAADALFPANSPIQEPIQPSRRAEPRANFRPLPPPGPPDSAALAIVRSAGAGGLAMVPRATDLSVGSNNWAVAPERTRDGHALLAGDPHLELSLPSIWYEAQLTVPGALDVYGVTIPGAPGIVIGFDRDIAWTFTNTEGDVVDRWLETVDDSAHPTRYRVDGVWRPVTARVQRYRGPRGEPLATDTIYWTHRGPMRRLGTGWTSMRWTALDSNVSVASFLGIERARSVAEFREASEAYSAPAQNMLVADRAGTIAIRSTGWFPLRAGAGRGDWFLDGGTSRSDWTGRWPLATYPQAVAPAQGFLASNNQQPIDPADDPRYLGAIWTSPWRAMRINQLLRANASVTADQMRRMQRDPRSARADQFVPTLLAAARARAGDSTLAAAATLLARWDDSYTADDRIAVLFEYTMEELVNRTWDELRDADSARHAPAPTPNGAVLAQLLQQPKSPWWDDHRTPNTVETRDDILTAALAAAYRRAVRDFGEPDDPRWRWGHQRHANIMHLLGIPALSALNVPSQGGPETLNPVGTGGRHGASWRMVVELGPELHAWGTYPGGQSGNPASERYLDHLGGWSDGALDTLRFPRTAASLDPRLVSAALTLRPAAH